MINTSSNTLAQRSASTASAITHSDRERQRWRIWVVVGGFLLLTSLVLIRLVDYQLAKWLTVPTAASANNLPLTRGVIVDRHGDLLAGDHFTYRVGADAIRLPKAEDRQALAAALQTLIGVSAAQIEQTLVQNANYFDVELAKNIPLAAGEKLENWLKQGGDEKIEHLLPYITVRPVPVRYYPQGALMSHLTGFVNTRRDGVYGLEAYYDAFLDTNSGIGLLQKTPDRLEQLAPDVRRFLPSMGAKDLVLTIDSGVQWIIAEEIARAVQAYQATGGTIIVLEPRSGAILGLVNWPDFNPNEYARTDLERFLNPAISLQYEPGSIFKLVTMAAALDTGVITPTTMFTDSGSITVGGRLIFNNSRVGYGRVSATEALARSLNVVTAQVAEQAGAENFYRYVQRFGFAQLTEVDLAGEVAGMLKQPGNELWSLSDLGTNSFGQGVAVTPIQMVCAVAAIANGGQLMRPYVVDQRVYQDQVLKTQPRVVRPVLKLASAHDLTEMMVETVETGNRAAGVAGYRIAGKSGTAQIPTKDGYEKDATIHSFIGFAPADDPRVVILVKIDRPDPNMAQSATHTAAPIFAQVARRLFDYLDIPPDAVRLGQ